MPLVIDSNEGSFRLNYLFNRIERSFDKRENWHIFYQDEADPLGTLFGLTVHRDKLYVVTSLGLFASDLSSPNFERICPQRKGEDYVDIESFGNMLYACTNKGIYQAASGARWRMRYDGSTCGHFFSLLSFNGALLTACEKGIYVASQEGRFWHPRYIGKDFGMFVAIDARDGVLYAQTNKGFCVSHDNGQHWETHPRLVGPWTNAMGGSMIFEPRSKKNTSKNK